MKMKKIAAVAMTLALVGGTIPFSDALTGQILTAQAADTTETEKALDSVLPSLPIETKDSVTIYKGEKASSFYMGGRMYNQGAVFNTSQKGDVLTFDVTDTKSLSFKLGHVDNKDATKCEMKIYLDEVLSDTIELKSTMAIQNHTIDVSKAKKLSFVIDGSSHGVYALGDITSDTEKPALASSKLAYKDMSSVLGSLFDTSSKLNVYSGTDKAKSFRMNGRTYYEGIAFTVTGSTSLNVEGCTKFKCSLGHLENTSSGAGKFNFYIDDKLAESVEVAGNDAIKDYELSIPKDSSVLRIELVDAANYGIGDITLDSLAIENKNTVDETKNAKELITNAYDLSQGTKYYGDAVGSSFKVNGRTYYEGIVFQTYTNNTKGSATFNTENYDKFSFSVGRVDNSNANKATLHIYCDNVEKQSIDLTPYDNAKKIDLDVKDVANVRLVIDTSASKYALMDITADDLAIELQNTSPEYDNVSDLLKSAYDYPSEARFYADGINTDSFKMNGRTYYEGFTITQGGVDNSLKIHNVCFNVEDINTISWDAGFVSNADFFHDSFLNVYIDNVLKEKIPLNRTMAIKECSYDVSKAATMRLEFNINSYSAYGIGNIKADKRTPSIATVIPEYKKTGEFLDAGYNRSHVAVYNGKEPDTVFFTMGEKNYDTGIKFNADGASDHPFISFNTEKVDGLKFSVGMVSYVYSVDSASALSIYRDNELYQKITLNANSEPVLVGVDTKDTDVVRLVMDASGKNSIAVVDMEMGEFDPASLTTTAATTTEPVTTTTTSASISDMFGDINGDGIIDGRDATILLTYYAKTSTGYTGTLKEFVDGLNGPKTTSETTTAAATTTETTAAATTTTKAPETTTKAPETTTAVSEDKPNSYGFYEVKNAPVSGISIDALTGTWDNAENKNQHLYIKGEGVYTGTYRLGDKITTESEGVIKLEYSLNPDGTKEYWYNLYDKEGKFVTGFGVTGDIPLTDLYAGQSGSPHFKLSSAE